MIMNNKVKGLLKGLRYISQIFDEEEKEMQIGYPTDVKHVAHIGCDGPTNTISWMNEYKSASVSLSGTCPDIFPTKELSALSINPTDSTSTEPLPESPAKRRHRRRSSDSESQLGAELHTNKDKDSTNRGSRHSRRHHSAGANSSSKEPSEGSSRRGRHSKPSTTVSESPGRDVPSIPKQPRRRKAKDETSSAAPIVVGIP